MDCLGVFKNPPVADVYIDLKHIPDLYTNKVYTIILVYTSPDWPESTLLQVTESSLVVGSAVPLSVLIELLQTHKDSSPSTFPQLADHLSKIGNVPVRNVSETNKCPLESG